MPKSSTAKVTPWSRWISRIVSWCSSSACSVSSRTSTIRRPSARSLAMVAAMTSRNSAEPRDRGETLTNSREVARASSAALSPTRRMTWPSRAAVSPRRWTSSMNSPAASRPRGVGMRARASTSARRPVRRSTTGWKWTSTRPCREGLGHPGEPLVVVAEAPERLLGFLGAQEEHTLVRASRQLARLVEGPQELVGRVARRGPQLHRGDERPQVHETGAGREGHAGEDVAAAPGQRLDVRARRLCVQDEHVGAVGPHGSRAGAGVRDDRGHHRAHDLGRQVAEGGAVELVEDGEVPGAEGRDEGGQSARDPELAERRQARGVAAPRRGPGGEQPTGHEVGEDGLDGRPGRQGQESRHLPAPGLFRLRPSCSPTSSRSWRTGSRSRCGS